MNRKGSLALVTGLAAATMLLVPIRGEAQDTHYWNTQFGPRSMLLNGAVVGSVHDMSATFYNPGALGYIKKPELLLSANVYAISSLTVRDGGGAGFDLKTDNISLLPNMLAGAFRSSWLGNNKFAYSFLTRYRASAELRGAKTARDDFLPQYPGEEDFAGGTRLASETKEFWGGLTWARGTQGWIGFGITSYLSIRTLESDNLFFAEALTDSGQVALYNDIRNYYGIVYSLLWKAGLGFNLYPLTLGLTVTTPNVQLYGTGHATANRTHIGVDMNNDGTIDDGFTATTQQGVDANYESPLSIAAGAGYHREKWSFSLTAEWFDAVDSYAVLELQPFVSQETGETVVPTLNREAKSVLNYAAGIEYRGEKYGGYAGFNTDFSSYEPGSDVSVTGFDLYHASAGADIVMGRTKVMLGLGYCWGSEDITQVINLNPDEEDTVIDPTQQVDIVYRRLTFLVGFTVNI